MPLTAIATTCIATKLASGNVQLQFQNPVGGIQFVVVLPSADVTTINTTVNGGSTGTTKTFMYTQDQNKADYPTHYSHSEGN